MFVKICGLFNRENLKAICLLKPDFVGCIFYPQSPRYITPRDFYSLRKEIHDSVKVTGVFVNESVETILEIISNGDLNAVQLYGDTAAVTAIHLRENGFSGTTLLSYPATALSTIKTDQLEAADYLLIDYPTKDFGGSGESFDWNILQETEIKKPFFLSGGLGVHNIDNALQIKSHNLVGFDFNSRLEKPNRIKDVSLVKTCIDTVRSYESR